MPYFIKCGDKVKGLTSHELIMEFAERKKLKIRLDKCLKGRTISKLAVALDFIKHSDQNGQTQLLQSLRNHLCQKKI